MRLSSGQPRGDRGAETPRERRARLAEVFGEVLPDVTGDERDTDVRPEDGDTWLRDQVPPHHGS